MSARDWNHIADRLNSHLAKARLSSQDVALKAGVDRKTVDRLRAGRAVRQQTLQWIEEALKLELREIASPKSDDAAPTVFGGYRKDTVSAYVGEYTGYRRSFDTPDHIIASYLEISWNDDAGALGFTENQRNRADSGKAYEYHFGGDVLIPPNLGVLHFVVRSGDGRVRLISTSMPREEQGALSMKGFILTLNELSDIGYYPVTSPIFFAKKAGASMPGTGVIGRDDERFAWADEILRDIEFKFLPYRSYGTSD